jgi:hypothetical protein
MKTTIWILSSCHTSERAPCEPQVFTSEADARAAFDAEMQEEWKVYAPQDESGTQFDYPGDPDRAHAAMIDWDDRYRSGWLITSHEIEVTGAKGGRFQGDYPRAF